MRMKPSLVPLLSSVLMLTACAGESSGPKDPFGPMSPTTVSTLAATDSQGQAVQLTVRQNETVVVNGRTYTVLAVGRDPTGASSDFKAFIDLKPDSVTFAGGEVYWGENGGFPFVSGTTDTPVFVNLDPPINVDQTVPIKGTAFLGDPSNPLNGTQLETTMTYRAIEKDTQVVTQAGVFSGVTRFTGSTNVDGTVINGEAWYHPDFGMLKGSIDWPQPNGSTLDLTGMSDVGSNSPGANTVRKMGLIDYANTHWDISTGEVGDGWTADRTKHAKMLLEMRFSDETAARDPNAVPQVDVEFGTVWGYFMHQLVASPISFFHPEDNGKGYTFWVAYVDQAGNKHQPGTEIYHISVDMMAGNPSPIQITGRIIYQKAPGVE